ncbi:MAG: transcriptional regulator [Archaeoglobus sp.]|nr:transcriptional regulator [Archaeoglobus sp.]
MFRELVEKLIENNALGSPVRLSIMLYLLPRGRVLFKDLLEILKITPGNLDSHLKRLEKEEYVKLRKVIADRPRTAVEITEKGAEEVGRYLKALRNLVDGVEVSVANICTENVGIGDSGVDTEIEIKSRKDAEDL